MNIFQAQMQHIEQLARLFDQDRVFYQQASDIDACQYFLNDRLIQQDSVIFVVQVEQSLIGFTQLYPSFSSVAMKRVWILNDLFVAENYRRNGVAQALIETAEQYAADSGAIRIVLATLITNAIAQKLYESRKYVKDVTFYHYSLKLA